MSPSVSWPELRHTLSSEVELWESGVEEGRFPFLGSFLRPFSPGCILGPLLKGAANSFHSYRSCPWKRR